MRSKEFIREEVDSSKFASITKKNYDINKQGLDNLKKSNIKLVSFGTHPEYNTPIYVYDNAGRYTVLVDNGDIKIPFYFSTGQGGKQNVAADKWYPFFGEGPDGWMNKGSEAMIINYYGSSLLKNIANTLNSTFPKPFRDPVNVAGWSGLETPSKQEFLQVLNSTLDPASRDDNKKFLDNMNNVLSKVGGTQYREKSSEKDSTSKDDTDKLSNKPNISQTESEPVVGQLKLNHNGNTAFAFNITTPLGRYTVKHLGDDYKFWDENQFRIEKSPDNTWKLIPNPQAKNKTMIDGKAITSPTQITKGMRIAVGNPEKGVEKLPLTVV